MGYFNVIQPCHVPGKGHYVNLPAQPIVVDDAVAAPLVESGCLAPYRPGRGGWFVEQFQPGQFSALSSGGTPDPAEVELVKQAVEDGSISGVAFAEPFAESEPQPEAAKPKPRSRSRRRSAEG